MIIDTSALDFLPLSLSAECVFMVSCGCESKKKIMWQLLAMKNDLNISVENIVVARICYIPVNPI